MRLTAKMTTCAWAASLWLVACGSTTGSGGADAPVDAGWGDAPAFGDLSTAGDPPLADGGRTTDDTSPSGDVPPLDTVSPEDAGPLSDLLDAAIAAPSDVPSEGASDAPADAASDLEDPTETWEIGPPPAPDGTLDTSASDVPPPVLTPLEILGDRYWNVYRPHFLADYFEDGRVTDRITAGVKMFGDNTVWMGKALSTFVYEHMATGQAEPLGLIHQILDAYVHLDALPADPAVGYLFADPLDGYVYRSDRGPDYTSNFCGPLAPDLCWPDAATRNNEPSGDQYLGTLRGLWDVVNHPGPLVHDGVDLKQLAREHAHRVGAFLRDESWIIENILGDEVKRGPDQRWISWSFQQGAAQITGNPKSTYESSWDVGFVTVAPADHHPFAMLFIDGALLFTEACSSGAAVDFGPLLGVPFVWEVDCNEFNIGLAGDAAVISLSQDPAHPDWFSTRVDRDKLASQGHAPYAMYARYRFNDDHPTHIETASRFLDAPLTPPTRDNQDPNGWCTSWRWAKDFDDPQECIGKLPGETYSGLDYMLPRAMASAYGEFPE